MSCHLLKSYIFLSSSVHKRVVDKLNTTGKLHNDQQYNHIISYFIYQFIRDNFLNIPENRKSMTIISEPKLAFMYHSPKMHF